MNIMDKNTEYMPRYINLEKLDHFIQFSLGRFKYFTARHCLYKSAGQYSYDIVNNKSILPDLVIYNTPFDKNVCFYGNQMSYPNPFPRKRFQVQNKKEGNPTKKKSSTNRKIALMQETQEPNMYFENDFDEEEDPEWMAVDVNDVAKGIKFEMIPTKTVKSRPSEKSRKVDLNELDQEFQNIDLNKRKHINDKETYKTDILDELFQENLDSYGIRTTNNPSSRKKSSSGYLNMNSKSTNDMNQMHDKKNLKNINQVPLNLNPINMNPYMNMNFNPNLGNPMLRMPPNMNNNMMNHNLQLMMNNKMNNYPMGLNNFTRLPLNQQMMMLNNMSMKPFNHIMNNQMDQDPKQPRFPGMNMPRAQMPGNIPSPIDYHFKIPNPNLQDPKSIIHRNLNEKGWFIQIEGKNMLNLNTFELFKFLSDFFRRGSEHNNITIQDFKTDMFFNPKALYENLVDTFSTGSKPFKSNPTIDGLPIDQPMNLNLNMNFMGNTYNNYMLNSRMPQQDLGFLNDFENQGKLKEKEIKPKKKSRIEHNLSADL